MLYYAQSALQPVIHLACWCPYLFDVIGHMTGCCGTWKRLRIMDLFSDIKAIIMKILGIDGESVTPEAHLHFDLGADSLALVTMSVAISEKYNVELLAEDIVELENISELISLVEAKINT
ncbi:MAG: acyl carrier protein [Chloroflexi bacterium]|nr:acyl carrier protein [Chloroflexota bacterium]